MSHLHQTGAVDICSLDKVTAGFCGRICAIDGKKEISEPLRRLGFHEGAIVECLSTHEPQMIRCGGACVAVGSALLAGVSVVAASL